MTEVPGDSPDRVALSLDGHEASATLYLSGEPVYTVSIRCNLTSWPGWPSKVTAALCALEDLRDQLQAHLAEVQH